MTQCTKGGGFPASGSSQTKATDFVAAGRLDQASGGETLRPSAVYSRGSVALSLKAGLETSIGPAAACRSARALRNSSAISAWSAIAAYIQALRPRESS